MWEVVNLFPFSKQNYAAFDLMFGTLLSWLPKCVRRYGGGPTLPRKAINSGFSQTDLAIEVYPLRLQLLLMPKRERAVIRISKKVFSQLSDSWTDWPLFLFFLSMYPSAFYLSIFCHFRPRWHVWQGLRTWICKLIIQGIRCYLRQVQGPQLYFTLLQIYKLFAGYGSWTP
jgi:hypothetical protein